MKLTLREETTDRSLERRWTLSGADPVPSQPLRPSQEFAPVDLRLWWQLSSGGRKEDSFRGHAWPAKGNDSDHLFASWSDATWGPYPAGMPQWVRDLADTVRADLEANSASEHDGQDFWGYGSKSRWDLEDAPLVTDRSGIEFVPVELDIWHSFYPDPATRPDREHRYSVYARSESRRRSSDYLSVQWGGTAERHDQVMSDWVRELVEAQYADLAAAGKASTAEREPACPACEGSGRVAAYPYVSVHDSWVTCAQCRGTGRGTS